MELNKYRKKGVIVQKVPKLLYSDKFNPKPFDLINLVLNFFMIFQCIVFGQFWLEMLTWTQPSYMVRLALLFFFFSIFQNFFRFFSLFFPFISFPLFILLKGPIGS